MSLLSKPKHYNTRKTVVNKSRAISVKLANNCKPIRSKTLKSSVSRKTRNSRNKKCITRKRSRSVRSRTKSGKRSSSCKLDIEVRNALIKDRK